MPHADLVMLCSAKLRSAAGSSTANLTRDPHEFPYKQLLIDVADKLTPGLTPLSWTKFRLKDDHKEEEIEQLVLDLFEEQARKKTVPTTIMILAKSRIDRLTGERES